MTPVSDCEVPAILKFFSVEMSWKAFAITRRQPYNDSSYRCAASTQSIMHLLPARIDPGFSPSDPLSPRHTSHKALLSPPPP